MRHCRPRPHGPEPPSGANPDLAAELEDKIKRKLGVGEYANLTEEPDADAPVDVVPDIDFDDEDDE